MYSFYYYVNKKWFQKKNEGLEEIVFDIEHSCQENDLSPLLEKWLFHPFLYNAELMTYVERKKNSLDLKKKRNNFADNYFLCQKSPPNILVLD